MSYTLHTDIPARDTARQIRALFEKWRGAEFITMPDRIDETAEVVFDYNENRVRVKYGQQRTYRDNLRAIYLTLEGLRMAHQRGLGDLLTNTVSQMLQLGQAAGQRDPHEVLGVRPDSPHAVAEAAYRALAKEAHPDAGGSPELMTELNAAIGALRNAYDAKNRPAK